MAGGFLGGLDKLNRVAVRSAKKRQQQLEREEKQRVKAQMLREARRFGDIELGGEPFPKGVQGLQLVTTDYNGKVVECYWFSAEAARQVLIAHLGIANDFIDEVNELCDLSIPPIEKIQWEVVPLGVAMVGAWGFTRITYEPVTASGNPASMPTKVYYEAKMRREPDTHFGIIHYNKKGHPVRMAIGYENLAGDELQINVGTKKGDLVLKSVTSRGPSGKYVLYQA